MRVAFVIALLAILAAVGVFAYEGLTLQGAPMPTQGYVAMTVGAVFSLVIGIGLMALLFYSSRRGYDQPPKLRPGSDRSP